MFWKPHGKPINYLTVESGQYVEGYVTPEWGRRAVVKHGYIFINNDGTVVVKQTSRSDTTVGYRTEGGFHFYSGRFWLFDGDRTSVAKKHRTSQSGMLGRLLGGW